MAKVTCVVSTYNAARTLRGRLVNLIDCAEYHKDIEIIVVNSGSTEWEDDIMRMYINPDAPFVYINSLRESIYSAWNRAISIATGDYIINCNTDDIFNTLTFVRMSAQLDDSPDVGLVYCDAIVTDTENATWTHHHISDKAPYHGNIVWPDYDPELLLHSYYGGPSPMWRRSLHDKYGLFDESFQLAGDYEWALRLAAHGVQMKHIPQALALFYDNGTNINNTELAASEARRAVMRWHDKISAQLKPVVE